MYQKPIHDKHLSVNNNLHLYIEDLKRKSFAVQRVLRDDEVTSPDFLDLFVDACQDAAALNRFLAVALDLPF